MTNFHAWKRRIWGPDWPGENGPPFRDAAGVPIPPSNLAPGPVNGADDTVGAVGAPSADITFTGTLTQTTEILIVIQYETGQWASLRTILSGGNTATDIAATFAGIYGGASPISATNVGGVLTVTAPTNIVEIFVYYGNYVRGRSAPGADPVDAPPPGPLDFNSMTVAEIESYAEGLFADGDPEKPTGWSSLNKSQKIEILIDLLGATA